MTKVRMYQWEVEINLNLNAELLYRRKKIKLEKQGEDSYYTYKDGTLDSMSDCIRVESVIRRERKRK